MLYKLLSLSAILIGLIGSVVLYRMNGKELKKRQLQKAKSA